jgi:hypothetical protein
MVGILLYVTSVQTSVIYLFYTAFNISGYMASNDKMINEYFKICGGKKLWRNLWYNPSFLWRGVRKWRKPSVRKAGLWPRDLNPRPPGYRAGIRPPTHNVWSGCVRNSSTGDNPTAAWSCPLMWIQRRDSEYLYSYTLWWQVFTSGPTLPSTFSLCWP